MNNKIMLYLLDMDGTIYLGDRLIDGAKEKIDEIRSKNKRICFLTNNSSKNPDEYIKKLARLGIKINRDEIYTSGDSAIRFLNKFYAQKSVFLLGTKALTEQFLANGINLVNENIGENGAKNGERSTKNGENRAINDEKIAKNGENGAKCCDSENVVKTCENGGIGIKPDVVVVGYDTELTYKKLCEAVTFIAQGAKYFVTHADINCPASPVYVPDVGSFVALIEKSCGRLPEKNFGKPYAEMAAAIAEKFELAPKNIAMIGDRLYTDIRFGADNGFCSILVLSGETSEKDYRESGVKADFVINSIKDLRV